MKKEDVDKIILLLKEHKLEELIKYCNDEQVKLRYQEESNEANIYNMLNNIKDQIPEELISYYNEEIKKIKGIDFPRLLILNRITDEEKIKLIEHFDNLIIKEEIGRTLENDESKMRVINSAKEKFLKIGIAKTLKSDENKINIIKQLKDRFGKVTIAQTLENDKSKLEVIKLLENEMDKQTVAMFLKSEESKLEAINLVKNESIRKTIANSLKNDEDKLKVIRSSKEIGTKLEVAKTLKEDKNKIEVIKILEKQFKSEKLINSFSNKDNEKKIQILDSVNIIATSLKNEKSKIEAIDELENDILKEKVAITLKSVEDKLKVINKITEDIVKEKIASTIYNDNEKLEVIKLVKSEESKARIAENLIEDANKLKVINLMKNKEAKVKVIMTLRNEENKIDAIKDDTYSQKHLDKIRKEIKDVDIIIENLKLFLAKDIKYEEILKIKKIILKMSESNNNIIKNIDFRILGEKYIKSLGEEKINLISNFSDVQQQIINLSDSKLEILGKCLECFEKENDTNDWTELASILLKKVNQYEVLIDNLKNDKNLTKEDILSLMKIMQNDNFCNIKTIEDVRNFKEISKRSLQKIIEDPDTAIRDKKNAVYLKIFGHDRKVAKENIKMFGEDIEKVESQEYIAYINALKEIENIYDEDILKEIFESCEWLQIDPVSIRKNLKKEFCKLYNKDLYKVKEDEENTENIYEAGTDFKIIMTSIKAFGGMAKLKDNYEEDWNRPSLASQYFCTSYIRNDMIGRAPVYSVCYGFSEMKEDSLLMSGCEDIYSGGKEFVASAWGEKKYYSPDEQINHTKGYNEMNFRRMQGENKKQPDYILVFKEYGEYLNMEEAKKAQKDWWNLPIVIIDVDKCLRSERQKVDNLMKEYRKNKDQEIAKEILQKVRNNKQTREYFAKDLEEELETIEEELRRNNMKKIEDSKLRKVNLEDFTTNLQYVNEMDRKKIIEEINQLCKVIEGRKENGR